MSRAQATADQALSHGLFSAEERQAIDAHIPWTRRVEERRTVYHGATVDLLPFCADQRKRLVLKANDEYGGKGIVLGWETPPEDWARALQAALDGSPSGEQVKHDED
jgi:hypothetical protein